MLKVRCVRACAPGPSHLLSLSRCQSVLSCEAVQTLLFLLLSFPPTFRPSVRPWEGKFTSPFLKRKDYVKQRRPRYRRRAGH